MKGHKPLTAIFANFGHAGYGLLFVVQVFSLSFPLAPDYITAQVAALMEKHKGDHLKLFILFRTCYSKHKESK